MIQSSKRLRLRSANPTRTIALSAAELTEFIPPDKRAKDGWSVGQTGKQMVREDEQGSEHQPPVARHLERVDLFCITELFAEGASIYDVHT